MQWFVIHLQKTNGRETETSKRAAEPEEQCQQPSCSLISDVRIVLAYAWIPIFRFIAYENLDQTCCILYKRFSVSVEISVLYKIFLQCEDR
jgi:hypothetical protein